MRAAAALKAAFRTAARDRGKAAAGGNSSPAWLFLALPAILLTPFVVFLQHHGYGLLRAESLLAMGLLCGLGLLCAALAQLRRQILAHAFVALALTFFLDVTINERQQLDLLRLVATDQGFVDAFQNALFPAAFLAILLATAVIKAHLSFIATVVFGVMLGSSLLIGRSMPIPEGTAPGAGAAGPGDLPPVIHLVLDEQIGIEGLPLDLPGGRELRDDLKAFYDEQGFTLFGQAFSHYYMTTDSLPNMLNGTARPERDAHIVRSGSTHRLQSNAWFARLADQGYRIKVLQTDYIDFCAAGDVRPADCTTYPANSIKGLMALELGARDKATIVFENFLEGTFLNRAAAGLEIRLRPELVSEAATVNAAAWHWHPRWLGSLVAIQMVEHLTAELRNLQPNTAYFAHLLLPHHALIYDRNCSTAGRLDAWMNSYDSGLALVLQRNTGGMRKARYERYFEQVRCAHRRLGEIFSMLRAQGQFERAVIIVHGDHGSRISRREPMAFLADWLVDGDLLDNFSTLFAVRGLDLPPGYRSETRSIQALFAEHFLGQAMPDEHGQVYLMSRETDLTPWPMPAFPR